MDHLRERLDAQLGDSYHIERELGGGGMSRVFVALETALKRRIVLKVLPPEMAASLSVERFNLEINLAATLQHPHIVQLLSAGEVDGLPYFTMPFVDGESLRARISREGPMPVSEAIRILREVASALDYAHSTGVVHRDIKPDNVLLSHGSAMVTDFGVARALSASATLGEGRITGFGMTLGTPTYMSPEQAAADPHIDHRADIYAWGVMAYEMLSGVTPFVRRTPQAMLAAQVSELPASLQALRPDMRSALSALVMRCLEKNPTDRPQSGAELVATIDAVVTPAHRASVSRLPQQLTSSSRLPLVVAALLVAVVAVLLAVKFSGSEGGTKASHASRAANSIAVMPFDVISKDSAQQYIADGMTDELAAALGKVPGLQVASRRSAYSQNLRNATAGAIGKALNVALLLDGTVQRVGDQLRVRVRLTRAADDSVLWPSQNFTGKASDVFVLQDSIAAAVVGALKLTLTSTAGAELAATRTKSLEAHDLYLKGRFEAAKHTKPALLAALDLFQQAIAADSNYALPWVGVADAYGWLADDYLPTHEAYAKAKYAAERGIKLAPTLAEAHAVLAWILYAHDWNFAAAERESGTAVALDSSSALAHSNRSYVLLSLGRKDEALAEIRRAVALEPLSASTSNNLEWHLLMQRKYADVIAQHAQTLKLDPTYFFNDSWVGVAYRKQGDYTKALETYKQAQALGGGRPLVGMVATLAAMGDTAAAKAELGRLEAFARTTHVASDRMAQANAAVGNYARAFEWFEKALAERSNMLLWLDSPSFDGLRLDVRYTDWEKRALAARVK